MPVMRSVLLIAAPALTALLGILWFTRRKKDPSIDYKKPPDKKSTEEIEQEQKIVVQSAKSQSISPKENKCVVEKVVKPCTLQTVNASAPPKVKQDSPSYNMAKQATPVPELNTVAEVSAKSSPAVMKEVKIKESSSIMTKQDNSVSSTNNNTKSTAAEPKKKDHIVGPGGDSKSEDNNVSSSDAHTTNKTRVNELALHEEGISNLTAKEEQVSSSIEDTVAKKSVPCVSNGDSQVSSDSSSLDSPDSSNSQDTVVSVGNSTPSVGDQTDESSQEKISDTESNTCDTAAADISPKSSSLESEVSQMTSQPVSSSTSSSNSKVASPILTSESDDHSELSADSGKGPSIGELVNSVNGEQQHNSVATYEFHFPTDLCGLLIGKHGKHINTIKEQSGARISVKRIPYIDEFQAVYMEGTQDEVDKALSMLRKRFPASRFPNVDFTDMRPNLTSGPVLQPEMMQLNLPDGVAMDVTVSSVVQPNHIFIQQPTHPTFPMLERMNQCMNMCYIQEGIVPELPRPIDVGVICAAPMYNGWYRAQVVQYNEETDECDIRYVDYGGYLRLQGHALRQIRSDFTTLPFQAVECYLANVIPPKDSDVFADEAHGFLESMVQGKLLQAEVVAHEEDGVPYIQLYETQGDQLMLVNRQLVDQGLAQWFEHA